MKKTAIAIALAILLCLLCACNPDPNNGGTGDNQQDNSQQEVSTMYITIYNNKLAVTLVDNSATKALVKLLEQGDITFTASNNGFEKYGNIGHDLPKSDTQIKAEAGDVLLYLGNNLCMFWGSNSWSYTRIGKINGYTATELATLLGADKGSAEVTLSLK